VLCMVSNNVYRYTPLYTHSVRPMSCGMCILYAEVNDLDEILNDRNRLLCWRRRPVMGTGGLVEQMLGEATRGDSHPMVMTIGSVSSGTDWVRP
jgi:hypothetical protein